jgi:hypothetical protein
MPAGTRTQTFCPWCPGATEAPREQVQNSICEACARKLIEGFLERHPAGRDRIQRTAALDIPVALAS